MKTLIVRLVLFAYAFVWACSLGAKEPVQYHCQGYIYPRMWCEAKYVYPFTPKWALYLKGTRVEYEDGIFVYLTVSDEWERAEACILDHCVTFYVRWYEGKLQFGEEK